MRSDLTFDLAAGAIVDQRFEIEKPLGMGGMGNVYRARDLAQGGTVALKMLHADIGDQEDPRLRFEREARALSALQHPHIVSIRGYGLEGGKPYLVMELLNGRTLTEILTLESPLAPDRALRIAAQVLDGVGFAHRQGIVHRDLKSPNILITTEPTGGAEHAHVLDFGFAKFFDKQRWSAEASLTAEGQVFGTPAYMSPEQASGTRVDARTDVYALGILLFELLTGRRPFQSKDRQELYKMQLAAPVPPLSEARPDLQLPSAVEDVIRKALAKEPRERFADATAMAEALAAAMTGRGGTSALSSPSPNRARTRAVTAWIGAAVLLALIVSIAIAAR